MSNLSRRGGTQEANKGENKKDNDTEKKESTAKKAFLGESFHRQRGAFVVSNQQRDGGKMVKKKGPKTMRGMLRKDFTGDGRKKLDTFIREDFFGKKKRKKS